jgi:Bifunctional DNA primase/polymerase, N-terminal
MNAGSPSGQSMVEWALFYAQELGWAVFPCHTPAAGRCSCGKPLGRGEGECSAKHPRTARGFYDATADVDEIDKWWTMWPDATIGSPTPCALDIEAKKSEQEPDGLATFRALLEEHGALAPRPPMSYTGSYDGARGVQLFFDAGPPTRGLPGGIEIRGAASYTILPPSAHFTGVRYEWRRPPTGPELPPLPDWILALSREHGTGTLAVDVTLPLQTGSRNTDLAALAFEQARLGKTADEIFGLLEPHARGAGYPLHDLAGICERAAAAKRLRRLPPEDQVDAVDPPNGSRDSGRASGEALLLRPPLAREPDILARFCRDLERAGLAGERRSAQILFLALCSRLLPSGTAANRPVSLVTKGTSSSGKSHTLRVVRKFFPEEAVFDLGSMSKRYLLYSEEPLAHRVVVIPEWALIKDDDEIVAAVRVLLSEGHLVHGTVDGDGRRKARRIEKAGPCGLVLTTTATRVDAELETRCLSFVTDDSPAQTRRVFKLLAGLENPGSAPVDFEPWLALQRWLAAEGEHRVAIPYVDVLADLMPDAATRLRRDFVSMLCLVRACALLHQATRDRDAEGQIIASIADYAIVHGLLDELVAEGVEAGVSPATRETVQAVRELLDETGADHVSAKKVTDRLGVGRSAAYDRVKRALAAGFLVNVALAGERGMKIQLGSELPSSGSFLPSPDEVVRVCPDRPTGQRIGSTMQSPRVLSGCPGRPVTPGAKEVPGNFQLTPEELAVIAALPVDENGDFIL